MSYRLAYDLTDPRTGIKHPLVLSGGLWHGDTLIYDFMLRDHGLSGRIECDWRSNGPRYTLDQGEVTTQDQRLALEAVTQALAPFFSGTFTGMTDEQLAALYPGDYHQGSGYCDEQSEVEKELKGAIAEMVVRTLGPGRVVDAGCAGGLLVRELRQRGADAYGFDHCPDLANIAVPDARPFVRQGSITDIPFGPEDRFDTLVCIDVFEHVPEDRVPQMVAEFDRLGVKNLAVHISHTELEHFGHITLRPLSWWDQQLGPKFRRVQTTGDQVLAIPRPWDPKRVLRIYQKVEAPIEITPARPTSTAARSGAAVPAASTPR